MKPEEYYTEQILFYTAQSKNIQRIRNLITFAKLLISGWFIFQIYGMITTNSVFILQPVLAIICFIFLTLQDNRILRKQHFISSMLRINTDEKDYLQGNLKPFQTGKEYADPEHPYSHDLDLFGEDSLFQHLNRTVTTNGTQTLVSWLLSPGKDAETIRNRQAAVHELAELSDWCQSFRASGKLHPIHHIDKNILAGWINDPLFFPHRRTAFFLLYPANSIVIGSWAIFLSGNIPCSIPLTLSLLQLLALTFYLKKINSYHRRLDRFIRSISHYLPLVKLIIQQDFRSGPLKNIRSTLSAEKCNALQAFISLDKIQNNLDQRANVLVAFLLNGLYLKDIHTVLKMDYWKKRYASCIPDWITAISETDAFVSMANYRFNHPDYCTPQISDKTLLETHETGHPLLKGTIKVTNDFKINSLHELYIITGANMAGKSTFLRAIGINLVLAHSGNVVYSSSFYFQPMSLFTSMRTTDNLAKNRSYFHAELLRLKQLIIMAEKEERLFIILDEMLKGTNSVDKLNGSLAFLKKLLHYPVAGLIATHDLALGELSGQFPGHFFNACFEITHAGEEIKYDYKLHEGISNTMNASILLKQMGLI